MMPHVVVRADSDWTPPPSANKAEAVPVLNHREAALGFAITFTIVAWTCSLLRLYTRFFILKSPWWDDLFIVFALLSTTVGSIIYCILPNYGQGAKHFDMLTLDEVNAFLKVFYIGTVTYPLSQTTIKLAVLFQYLRIFEPESRRRQICKFLICLTSAWGLIYTFPTWVPCSPPSDMWNVAKPNRICWGFASPDLSQALGFYISHSVTTTVLDFVLFLLPMNLYFRFDTHRNSRVALLCLFSLGIIVNLLSIGRLIYSLTPTLDSVWDLTWNSATPSGLAAMEINLATVCAALPIFWPVIQEKWNRFIMVTHEVRITRESGEFTRIRHATDGQHESQTIELESGVQKGFEPMAWDPYVRDTKTAMGDIETTVQSPAEKPVKLRVGNRDTFFLCLHKN